MDSLTRPIPKLLHFLFIITTLLCLQPKVLSLLFTLQYKAETCSSVVFIDSLRHQYIRSATEIPDSISAGEIGAAVSVLLGFSPPASLSSASSSKLNEVLMPNPFDRPRHVLLLQVPLSEGSRVVPFDGLVGSSRATVSKMIQGSEKVRIELPDEDEVAFFSLDNPEFNAYEKLTDKDISHFASWVGGSYVADGLKPISGMLVVLLPSGAVMKLELSKTSENKYARSLISLVGKIRRAMEMHYSLPGSKNLAGLMTSSFKGIKALEEYGPRGTSTQGMELLIMMISKILENIQVEFKDQIVGVIILYEAHSSEPDELLDITAGSLPLARFLEEAKTASNSTKVAEVVLVRKTLAWITGIVLIIATIFGTCLLMNMPITRDTLLYSNVKLD